MIDLRSDTVTKPTREMLAAMASAEVGDDVYGEDPTVNRLQDRAAELFEKEAALYVASGTMGNQIAVKVHTRPGQEVVTERRSHVYNFELGMAAILSGVTFRPIVSADGSGHLTWKEIAGSLQKGDDHSAETGLICLENTHNMGGGTVMSAEQCDLICRKANELSIPVHLDGARIFNASVASDTSVAELSRGCDSVQFCLSKGLGAPVGSVLVGSRAFIQEAHLWRKRLGGGMRQAGIIAAAGLVALNESPKRMHEDHQHASYLAREIAKLEGIELEADAVTTNIVIFKVTAAKKNAAKICEELRTNGVLTQWFGSSIRMVTHYGISKKDIDSVISVLRALLS